MILFFNIMAIIPLIVGIGFAVIAHAFAGSPTGVHAFAGLGTGMILADLALRLKGGRRKKRARRQDPDAPTTRRTRRSRRGPGLLLRLIHPLSGGHVMFIPMWIFGALFILLAFKGNNAPASQRGATGSGTVAPVMVNRFERRLSGTP